MFFIESERLAEQHLELAAAIERVDAQLVEMGTAEVLRPDDLASFLGIDPNQIRSVLDLLAGAGVLVREEMVECAYCQMSALRSDFEEALDEEDEYRCTGCDRPLTDGTIRIITTYRSGEKWKTKPAAKKAEPEETSIPPVFPDVETVARGLFKDGERNLTQQDYDAIIRNPKAYDIVVDQLGRRSWKMVNGKLQPNMNVNKTYFSVLREIVSSRRPFDPTLDSKVLDARQDGKQTCQRMRNAFDIKKGRKRTDEWRMIKSHQTDDFRVCYQFRPDEDLLFAILFTLPR